MVDYFRSNLISLKGGALGLFLVMSDDSGSTAGDDTRPIGDANEETNRDTSGSTEEESSGVLTPSVDTTAQGMSKRGVRSKQWVL